MKITVKSTINQNKTEIETQSTTLGALLAERSTNDTLTDVQFFDPTSGEVYPDCDVHLNGQPFRALADGLDTKLKTGDSVEIIQVILSGG